MKKIGISETDRNENGRDGSGIRKNDMDGNNDDIDGGDRGKCCSSILYVSISTAETPHFKP